MSQYSPSKMRHSYLQHAQRESHIDDSDLLKIENTKQSYSSIKMEYSLAEVVITESPVDDEEEDWCYYVLVRGNSKITGYHRGSVAEVTNYANNYLIQINERNRYNKSKYPIKSKNR